MKKRQAKERPDGLRIAAYIRVSTQHQALEGDSLEAQKNAIQHLIEYKVSTEGWVVASIEYYEDAGRSAKDQNRPQLQRMKRDIAAGLIDAVVCFKLDRITRNLSDFLELWKLFEKHDVDVIIVRDKFDTSTAMGMAMLHLVMVFAQLERGLTRERTVAVMRDRVERGLRNGGRMYGYTSDPREPGKLIPDPEWAPIIKTHFFDAFEELGSAGKVQQLLKRLGILVPERQSRAGNIYGGVPFKKQQVIGILRCPLYIGRIQWGEAFKDDCHEPLIPRAQFERVQRLLDANKAQCSNSLHSRDYGYPLRGLVRCRCGAMMTPKGARGRKRKYHYYSCTRKGHQGGAVCDARDIPAEALEQAVVQRLSQLGSCAAERERIIEEAMKLVDDDAREIEATRVATQHRLSACTAEIDRLIGLLKQPGFAALGTVCEELRRLETERGQLNDRLTDLENRAGPMTELAGAAREFIRNWGGLSELLTQATPEELRTVLMHYVEVIEIRPDDSGNQGEYALAVLPGPQTSEEENEPHGEAGLLTQPSLVRRVDEKAPPGGLEPPAFRLTAGGSTFELQGTSSGRGES